MQTHMFLVAICMMKGERDWDGLTISSATDITGYRDIWLYSQLKAGASDRERICSTAHLVGASERAQSRVTRRRVVRGFKPNVPEHQ